MNRKKEAGRSGFTFTPAETTLLPATRSAPAFSGALHIITICSVLVSHTASAADNGTGAATNRSELKSIPLEVVDVTPEEDPISVAYPESAELPLKTIVVTTPPDLSASAKKGERKGSWVSRAASSVGSAGKSVAGMVTPGQDNGSEQDSSSGTDTAKSGAGKKGAAASGVLWTKVKTGTILPPLKVPGKSTVQTAAVNTAQVTSRNAVLEPLSPPVAVAGRTAAQKARAPVWYERQGSLPAHSVSAVEVTSRSSGQRELTSLRDGLSGYFARHDDAVVAPSVTEAVQEESVAVVTPGPVEAIKSLPKGLGKTLGKVVSNVPKVLPDTVKATKAASPVKTVPAAPETVAVEKVEVERVTELAPAADSATPADIKPAKKPAFVLFKKTAVTKTMVIPAPDTAKTSVQVTDEVVDLSGAEKSVVPGFLKKATRIRKASATTDTTGPTPETTDASTMVVKPEKSRRLPRLPVRAAPDTAKPASPVLAPVDMPADSGSTDSSASLPAVSPKEAARATEPGLFGNLRRLTVKTAAVTTEKPQKVRQPFFKPKTVTPVSQTVTRTVTETATAPVTPAAVTPPASGSKTGWVNRVTGAILPRHPLEQTEEEIIATETASETQTGLGKIWKKKKSVTVVEATPKVVPSASESSPVSAPSSTASGILSNVTPTASGQLSGTSANGTTSRNSSASASFPVDDFSRSWVGMYGKRKIGLFVEQLTPTEVSGYTIVGQTRRPFKGEIVPIEDRFQIRASEPGDIASDGTYQLLWVPAQPNRLSGQFSPMYQGVLSKVLNLKPQECVGNLQGGRQYAETILPEAELRQKTPQQLSIMRGEILARHGYSFKNIEMAEYFAGKDWYVPCAVQVDNLLNTQEQKNLENINKAEPLGIIRER